MTYESDFEAGFETDEEYAETELRSVQCPFCWEYFDLQVDASGGDSQVMISDCDVCCRPIEFHVRVVGGKKIKIEARRTG